MNRQWQMVAVIVSGLGLGAWALTRYAPPPVGAQVGNTAPEYRVLDTATGDSVSLRADYDGKVVLVNVWATWCLPCRLEMPAMERLYQEYKDDGFRIAAVSVDEDSPERVRAFAEELGLTFDILHDRSNLIQPAYQTIGLPQSYLIDKQGKIQLVAIGEERWDSDVHRARVAALLAE